MLLFHGNNGYLFLLLFHGNNGYLNVHHCYFYTYITCFVALSCDQVGLTILSKPEFISKSLGQWLFYCSNITLDACCLIYTGCPRRNVPDFGRVFLMLKYTDITQNTYVQIWMVTEIMAREKCGLLAGPRTVPVSWQVLSMFVLECGVR